MTELELAQQLAFESCTKEQKTLVYGFIQGLKAAKEVKPNGQNEKKDKRSGGNDGCHANGIKADGTTKQNSRRDRI